MKDNDISIIVVEDDEDLARILKRMFAGVSSFASFATSSDFLARAELENCDIVFMDINIPGGQDGLSLTRHIKKTAPQCDVVVMTGEATLGNAMAAIKAGAYDFIPKPFSYDYVESMVDRCMEKRRISTELNLIKAAQEELAAAYSQLKSSERMKEAFLSVIGHELRTPLAKILGGVELLREAPEPQRAELFGVVEKGATALRDTLETLILYSDSKKEPVPQNCSEVDVNEAASSVLTELRPEAESAGVVLSVRQPAEKALVTGNPDWIRAAIKRLALNAIKFNSAGGSAEIAVMAGPGTTSVTVSDTGIGIPEELLSGMGNPFYQVADYLTRKTGGLGLGLAIVKQVAEAHGGGMSVKSSQGKGTAFTITFKNTGACGNEGKKPGAR